MKQKIAIYQLLPRLFANKQGRNLHGGNINENGCGKMNYFSVKVLQGIRKQGFTHVWYTGLIEHATCTDYSLHRIAKDTPAVVKGQAGSPYAIKDYYDIDPDLATNVDKRMEEFEQLVKRTHTAGLKMVIDFVPNHVARQYHSDAKPKGVRDLGQDDNTSMGFSPKNNFYYICGQSLNTSGFEHGTSKGLYEEYPAKATGNDKFDAYPSQNDWYETIKLNYGVDYCGGHACHFSPRPDTWDKMCHILLFWASKGIDAFRCDMAEMVPCEFWQWAIAEVKKKYPNIRFIAEVYNPSLYRDYIGRGGFDYLYDKVGLYDTLRSVVCHGQSAAAITGCWQAVDNINSHMLNFLENHDEQRIASHFFAGNAQKAIPAFVISACINTNPVMVYAGQEIGEPGMDNEGFSGVDGRTTIFDYWCVRSYKKLQEGSKSFTAQEKQLFDTYSRIVTLCNSEAAIREGKFFDLMYVNYDRQCGFNPDRQFAFLRQHGKEAILVISNFDSCNVHVGVKIPQAAFDYMGLKSGNYVGIDLLSGNSQTLELHPDDFAFADINAHNAVMIKLKWK